MAQSFALRYAGPSSVEHDGLLLASSSEPSTGEAFFRGVVADPEFLRRHLRVLARLVASDFRPRPASLQLDPVVTGAEAVLRFEGVSGCASVYGRVDARRLAFADAHFGRGTTNVDFGASMIAALDRVGFLRSTPSLSVSRADVTLRTDAQTVVEKKVRLPDRWVRSFSESVLHQRSLQPRLRFSGAAFRALLASAPQRLPTERVAHLVPEREGRARWSLTARPGAVTVGGPHRLRLLEPLLVSEPDVVVWAADEGGVVGVQVEARAGDFTILLSPRVDQSFSGLGSGLLAFSHAETFEAVCRAQLAWQAEIDASEMARQTGLSEDAAALGLARLAGRGLVGFDVGRGTYFHRELPFGADDEGRLHPRLENARTLARTGAVSRIADAIFDVRGSTQTYRVTLGEDLDPRGGRCTCTWFRRGTGPCKHLIAAFITRGATS